MTSTATSIATPTLQFLKDEKQKYIYTTDMTSYWHSYHAITMFMRRKAKTCMYNYLVQLLV